jgi:acetoin utilization deacetylase AcuC-like enzyme
MKILFNEKFLQHNVDSSAEGAYRIKDFKDIENTEVDGEKNFSLIHDKDYIKKVKEACMNNDMLAEVQLTKSSYEAAKTAVGLAVLASRQNDFAVIRPPGHHAGRSRSAGFCFFNNLAIATQKLVNEGKKVFILDIDGHHGDGTQGIFYDTDEVFFCSIHQLYAYPFTGMENENGEGKGEGFTMNIPLVAESGDKEFMAAIDKAIMMAVEFNPDVIAVSAGFDGYKHDKLLNLNYSLDAFFQCGLKLRRSFGNIFAVLEGGYHNDIRKCVDSFIEGVNKGGNPPKSTWNHEMSMG